MPTVNIKAFSHKKSTVIENGGPKLPTAAQLELGEIAMNFAKGYETLSIKNNNNEIVTFTNDNYWINKELAIAAALNDLNDRKQDALEMDETPTEGSENVVTSGGLYSYITEIEQVTAAALNDLNDRITSLALSDDYAAAAQGTPPLAGDTYETAISKLHKVVVDDELITSSALNDLNSRIDNLSLSEDYEATDIGYEPESGDTYEEAISKLHGAVLENELATSGALNDLNTRINNIVIPDLLLSEDYEPSSLSNLDLFLEPGDSYETAFSKLEKTINDNENITSAALTDLDSRLNSQSLDDIPDGSTRRLVTDAEKAIWNNKSDFSGSYNDLSNKPTTLAGYGITDAINTSSTAQTKAGNLTAAKFITSGGTSSQFLKADGSVDSNTYLTSYTETDPVFSASAAASITSSNITTWNDSQLSDLTVHTTSSDDVNIRNTDKSVSEILTAISEGRNVKIAWADATLPLVYHNETTIIYSLMVSADGDSSLSAILPKAILSVVQTNNTASFAEYDLPTDGIITINENDGLDLLTDPGIYKVISNVNDGLSKSPYIVLVEEFKINALGTNTKLNYVCQTRIRGDVISYRQKNITNEGSWSDWENILDAVSSRIDTLTETVAYSADLATVATSGSYNDLSDKPTIPSAVTESTVSGWGFTKNAGTVTGVKMNGTTKNPTSGVVDLGTVLTSETDPTVPAWAKASTKPTYTAQEVGALPNTYTPPVTSVNGQTGAVNLTIPSAPGTLNTTATTAQSTSSSEALSGNITLHKVAKTGTYSDLIGKPTIPTVNNATLTIQKNGTTVNTFTANASSNVTANIQVNELPTVSSSDNGKVLQVVSGAWSLVMPTAIYSGTSAPNNSVGNDGDLYLQTS